MSLEKEKHESFGLLSFSRVTHSRSKLHLFGSSINHGNTIVMRVSNASRHRDLSRDFYFPEDTIIEIEMSPTQFSEAITSFNMGSGSPVTIRRIQGKGMEDPPCTDIKEKFEGEFKETVQRAHSKSKEALKKVDHILSQKSIKKSDLRDVKDLLIQISHNIGSNQNFVYSQFNEQVDRSITEAKGEIEAFIENKVRATGLESIGQQFNSNTLLEGKVDEDNEEKIDSK